MNGPRFGVVPFSKAETTSDVRTAAVTFGLKGARSMLTRGRIERHLSENELAALLAVAFQAGAMTVLTQGGAR